MEWTIYFSNKAEKQVRRLNDHKLLKVVRLLVESLRINGPFPGEAWSNYSKLKGMEKDCRHCHLLKGRPTYVCCWEVIDKSQRIIEVYYVGSHEKAPY